ncbi:MAG TPA: V-type ATP synthase subunit D [Thermoplasmatales archaeon]|nr:V-type ATP synthase subunit D [Thermoplasmatales archaeon]
MKSEIIEGVKPTRMELLRIRKRLELAEKGHKLLEDKRDALIERFFKSIKRRDEIKREVEDILSKAMQALIEAEMIMGIDQVRISAKMVGKIGELRFLRDNIMGVKVPKIDRENLDLRAERFYSFTGTCIRLDEAKKLFEEALRKLIDLAEIDGAVKALALEIEKTKRRVNVLENVLIPKLQATRKRIEMLLEEREREDFFRRKRIKAIMERRSIARGST